MEQYYKAMPEQFYAGSNLPVITPSNVKSWVEQMLADGHRADIAKVSAAHLPPHLVATLQDYELPSWPTFAMAGTFVDRDIGSFTAICI